MEGYEDQLNQAMADVQNARRRIRNGDTSKEARDLYARARVAAQKVQDEIKKNGSVPYKKSDGTWGSMPASDATAAINKKRQEMQNKYEALAAKQKQQQEELERKKAAEIEQWRKTIEEERDKAKQVISNLPSYIPIGTSEERQARREKEEQELAEYKKQRAESQAKQAEQRKINHENTMKQRIENEKQAVIDAQGSYERAKAALEEFTKQDIEDAQDMSKHTKFTGSSEEAKNKLKSDMKQLLQITTGEATDTVKAAFQASKEYADTQGSAGAIVNSIMNGKIFKDPKSQFLGYTKEQLSNLSSQSLLDLEKLNCSDRLVETMLIDSIADQVMGQREALLSSFGSYKEAYLHEKAYITAYFQQTFGNPEFLKGVRAKVYVGVSDYIDALSQEQLDKFGAKIDQKTDKLFGIVDNKIDRITSKVDKITTKLDNLTKIDILASMSNKIDSVFSMDSLEKKLNKTFLGSLIAPTVAMIGQSVGGIIKLNFTSPKFLKKISAIQDKIKVVQQQIQKAKEFIANKVQMVKNYVNDLKQKAIAAVKSYATQIINDITSKIKLNIGGALGF